jgi:hypothetical protein
VPLPRPESSPSQRPPSGGLWLDRFGPAHSYARDSRSFSLEALRAGTIAAGTPAENATQTKSWGGAGDTFSGQAKGPVRGPSVGRLGEASYAGGIGWFDRKTSVGSYAPFTSRSLR